MKSKITKMLLYHTFWLSLLFHVLLFLSFTFVWVFAPEPEEKPSYYVPSYVARNESNPVMPPAPPPQLQSAPTPQKNVPVAKNGIHKKPEIPETPRMPSANQMTKMVSSKESQGLHLVGDKKLDKPLIKLLGMAISAHLSYPKIAADFNVRGLVGVGFMVYPDGHITDIQLVKSSGADVLDRAALSAVGAISPVNGVGQYLPEAKFLVVGFIFN